MQKDYERMRIYIEELNKEKANLQSQLARNEATSIISNVCFSVRVTFEIILENLIMLYLLYALTTLLFSILLIIFLS